jgi:hypothetical protein
MKSSLVNVILWPLRVTPLGLSPGDSFMRRIIWRFRAKAKRVDEFCNVYGWKGKWAKLFGCFPEYEGTILLEDLSDPLVFIVIDRWALADSFTRSQQLFRPDSRTATDNATS